MRALIVGLGRMGQLHQKILHDLGYQTVTVDPNPDTDADYRTVAHAVLPPHQRHQKYDVAAIATPADALVETAFALAGTRMLVEKPFATDSRTAAMLGAYLEKAGAPVCVGFVERYNPQIRDLKRRLPELPRITRAKLTRWSDRPSWDLNLDLALHDIDLVHHLGLGYALPFGDVEFDTQASLTVKVRDLELEHEDGTTTTVDLMDHTQSPLHALWHAFLTDQPDVPGPADAVRALQTIEHMRTTELQEAA